MSITPGDLFLAPDFLNAARRRDDLGVSTNPFIHSNPFLGAQLFPEFDQQDCQNFKLAFGYGDPQLPYGDDAIGAGATTMAPSVYGYQHDILGLPALAHCDLPQDPTLEMKTPKLDSRVQNEDVNVAGLFPADNSGMDMAVPELNDPTELMNRFLVSEDDFVDLEPTAASSVAPQSMTSKEAEPAPRRRVVKPQISKTEETGADIMLVKAGQLPPTGQYQCYFASKVDADEKHARLTEFYRKPASLCTFPDKDETFPGDDAATVALVIQVFYAIYDWSNFREWPQTIDPVARSACMDSSGVQREGRLLYSNPTVDGSSLTSNEWATMLPPIKEQQQAILGRELNDQMVEWMSWDLVESYSSLQARIDAICHALRQSKQLVKSLLSAGDGWTLRIANNPLGELKHKGNNRKVNLVKNQKLRDATKAERNRVRKRRRSKA
ncbi:hypothetical protein B0I35DRAFT_476151 [Stachybotrys elegans]|uniref:Uncharacterized protein n=1 Tax=Stachybotrys elegans TaxID=80388 RepID=A0A8K0WVZ4_9HYPO|nr:hypothetical protein B0I35DRAFT_476151 [Stachybotrys elegans]